MKKRRKKRPCIECGKQTSAADGVCHDCCDGTGRANDHDSGTPFVPYLELDLDTPEMRPSEQYHGDVYRDDI